jgi:hypothetical protein
VPVKVVYCAVLWEKPLFSIQPIFRAELLHPVSTNPEKKTEIISQRVRDFFAMVRTPFLILVDIFGSAT